MRVLMVGSLSIQYVRESWVESLRGLYDATFVDILPLLSANRERPIHEEYLYDLLRTERFDVLFFYADDAHQYFSDEFFENVRAAGVPIVSFYADDEPEIWYRKNVPFDHRFDRVGTHSARGLQRRLAEGKGDRFLYLPWGYNEQIFDRRPAEPKLYDVVYIGSIVFQETDSTVFFNDFQLRLQLLEEIQRLCQANHLRFRVFGTDWEKHPVLGACAGGRVSTEEMVRIYSQSKIVFNPGFAADNDIHKYQTKLRHFEVAGCGCCQLTNWNPELAELFAEGQEILFFRDVAELKARILHYTAHDDERQRIADRMLHKAREGHTLRHRLTRLLGEFEKRPGATISAKPPCSAGDQIHTLRPGDPAEAREQLRGAADGQHPKRPLVHLSAGCFDRHTAEEYSLLSKEALTSGRIVAVQSYLQLAYLHQNPFTRKSPFMNGLILKPRHPRAALKPWVLDWLRGHTWILEDGEWIYPLFNYLIPAARLPVVLPILLAGDVQGFLRLPLLSTGLVVNDYRIPAAEAPAAEFIPPYVERLRQLLRPPRPAGERVLIYGARGAMADQTLLTLKDLPGVEVVGVIDRSLVGKKVGGYPVYAFEDLERLDPTLILIAAEFSGREIRKSLGSHACKRRLLPLYDLNHPVWEVTLPGLGSSTQDWRST